MTTQYSIFLLALHTSRSIAYGVLLFLLAYIGCLSTFCGPLLCIATQQHLIQPFLEDAFLRCVLHSTVRVIKDRQVTC